MCVYIQQSCLRFSYGHHPHVSSIRVLRIRDEASSQAMQICKVSARDMIGEENLKQKNNF